MDSTEDTLNTHKTFVNTLVLKEEGSKVESGSLDTSLMAWNETTLVELGASTLLSLEDVEKLKFCAPAISHAFNKTQMFRTRTEMDVSVLNDVKFPTPDSKFWQSVREMNVMVENLIMLGFNFKRKVLDLKEKEHELERVSDTTEEFKKQITRERLIVDIEQTRFEIAVIQREAHHRIREVDQWREIQDALKPLIAAGTDEVDNHQLLSYAIRFLREYQISVESGVEKAGGVEAIRNLHAHVTTTLRVINDRGLTQKIIQILSHDVRLCNFLKKKDILHRIKPIKQPQKDPVRK